MGSSSSDETTLILYCVRCANRPPPANPRTALRTLHTYIPEWEFAAVRRMVARAALRSRGERAMRVEFNPELLQRYGGNVPRYTSYPTALQFHEHISAADYAAAARGRSAGSPVSIYVHVPFCWSPCYYCACNRIITHQGDTATQYVERLMREIDLRARCFEQGRPAAQLHFGGGTPTYLSTAILSDLVKRIGRHFPLVHTEA